MSRRHFQSRAAEAWFISAIMFLVTFLFGCSSSPSGETLTPDADDTGSAEAAVPPTDSNPDSTPCVLSSSGCTEKDSDVDTGVPTDATDDTDLDSGTPDTMTDPDTGTPDSGVVDSGSLDSTVAPDTNVPDSFVPPIDTGLPDTYAPPVDTGSPDTNVPPADTGTPDTSVADTNVPDTTIVDSGTPDTSVPPADTGTDSADSTVVDTGTPDTSVADTGTPDTGTPDTGTPDTGTVARSFKCDDSSWTMDKGFHDLQLTTSTGKYDIKALSGIWGTSLSNIYATVGVTNHGAVAHYNGTSWVQEEVDTSPEDLGDPMDTRGIWGMTESSIWVAGHGASRGILYHKVSGVWTKDAAAPFAIDFGGIWGNSESDRYLVGWKIGESIIWRNTGTSWVKQTLPAASSLYLYRALVGKVWGLDSSHVYVPGYYMDSTSTQVAGFVMFFNGTSWTEIAAPSECVEVVALTGTSSSDLFATCAVKQTGTSGTTYVGGVYHVTNNMSTWTGYTNPLAAGYGPIWSKFPGTVLAAASYVTDSSIFVTTMDQVSSVATHDISGSFIPSVIWEDPTPGSSWFLIGHGGPGSGKAGIYAGSCN
jgi:hypothetical protein